MKPYKLIALILFSVILFSCDKVQQTEKKLAGEWSLIDYRVKNIQGLAYDYPASGSMNFTNFSGETGEYSLNVSYEKQGVMEAKVETGTMILHDDGEYFQLIRNNMDGTKTTLEDGRLIVLTTSDLKITFADEYGLHEFILEK